MVIPLHNTLCVTAQVLALAAECVITCKGAAAGLGFARGLAAHLRDKMLEYHLYPTTGVGVSAGTVTIMMTVVTLSAASSCRTSLRSTTLP